MFLPMYYKEFKKEADLLKKVKDIAKAYGYELSETDGIKIGLIKTDLNKDGVDFISGHITHTYKYPTAKAMLRDIEAEFNNAGFRFSGYVRNEFDLAIKKLGKNGRIDEYGRGGEVLKELLQKKGYDGIIFNDFQVSVFDSKQIKEVANHGKDGRYFDGENPNIYYKEATQASAPKDAKMPTKNQGKEMAKTKTLNPKLRKYRTLQKYGVENLDLATQETYEKFVKDVYSGEQERKIHAPNILYIANLNEKLAQKIEKKFGANSPQTYLTKNDLLHFNPDRKSKYNQALREDEILELPQVIGETESAYFDPTHENLIIKFDDKLDKDRVNLIMLNVDELGNFIVTTAKVNEIDFRGRKLEVL